MNSNAAAGSSTNDSTNNTAIAAAVLAAGAFVVAFTQTLLDYFSSSESRNKCTYAAIHVASKQVRFGWSWKFWKLEVYYPALYFDYETILSLLVKSNSQHAIDADDSPISALRHKHDWQWRSMMEEDQIGCKSVA
ncbi:hypothetical protein BDV29DRAFT_163900 [Aspergillus leporis]|uniref:Uncharacterized protein n=1 Tax=Aspergillus leporis TaxID=41062 RepID=A0A5N5WIR7_9EURO|nr:hypothetical protein BDV29DRAFT_163900 [Aspergillus leporis]